MRKLLILACFGMVLPLAWARDFANAYTVPPVQSKAALNTELNPIPQSTVEAYLQFVDTTHVFTEFQGQNAQLKSLSDNHKQLLVGSGFAVDLASPDLFGAGFDDSPYRVFETSVSSVDAHALRLLVDLSQLKDGEEAWVIDLNAPRAFGPYTAADAVPGGRWLPTTEGESAVLMVRTTGAGLPQVRLLGVSHFFKSFEEGLKVLSCNNNIACETDATIQNVSTGVGIMVIPQGTFDQALCTGSLINNPDTPQQEPYLLTSYHCVPEYVNANQVDIVWDYRATACNTNDPPALSTLPRSSGQTVLTTSNTLDLTLMLLDTVPSGSFGRTYLGWETRDPVIGEDVVTIHYPDGSHMRISYGNVLAINQQSSGFFRETKVHWYDGVTEGGSSGSPLLLAASDYRLAGTLSNGTTHSCTDTTNNVDWYTSFRDFYPQAQGWLKGSNPPVPGTGSCPAAKAFQNSPQVLADLRALRDKGLLKTAWGKPLVDAYYAAAPYLARLVDWSPRARDAFRLAAAPFAAIGALLS